MIKKILLTLLIVLMVLSLAYYDLLSYAVRQAAGQLSVSWSARPIHEVLADEQFPDSLKNKLLLVEAVRKFAVDSLGLKETKNYQTVYDQKGEEILWVVTASEPFRLVEKRWHFPVLGSMPYKGFFNKKLALKEKAQLEASGWDVNIRNPGGWSTLGWFTDPILSGMLERSEGDLASLIIHEMVHATIFVKDSSDFNENLASFIGDRGAEQFLIHHFGRKSSEYQHYVQEDREHRAYVDHMLRGCDYLDSVYQAVAALPDSEKRQAKRRAIGKIIQASDTLNLSLIKQPSSRYRDTLPNNAYFLNFKRYQSRQDDFLNEWENTFKGNLREYIQHLSKTHPFL